MRLLSIEFSKVVHFRTFWIILLLYAILVPATFFGLSSMNLPFFPGKSELFGFPSVWGYLTWVASCWNILLGVLIVILTCNEIAYKTQRQSVIDGFSRKELVLAKFLFLIVLAFFITLYTFLVGAIFGSIYSDTSEMFTGMESLPLYLVQTVGYFSVALFFALLFKKPSLAIMLFVVVIMLDGMFIPAAGGVDVGQFIPTITISYLTPFPFFADMLAMAAAQQPDLEIPYFMPDWMMSALATVYIIGFMVVNFVLLKRRDL